MPIYDISLGLSEQMPVWAGDQPLQQSLRYYENGLQVTRFTMGAHAGTHMDAPRHMLGASAPSIDHVPLDALVGPATVADLTAIETLNAAALAARLGEQPPCRLLLKLRADPMTAATFMAYAAPDVGAARWLVAHGVRLLGLDVPSVDAPESDEYPVHRVLLKAGVVIIENLVLDEIAAGDYQCACLPLKLLGADGAPARVVLWR